MLASVLSVRAVVVKRSPTRVVPTTTLACATSVRVPKLCDWRAFFVKGVSGKGDWFFGVVVVSRKPVKGGNVLVCSDHLGNASTNVAVVHKTAFLDRRVLVIQKVKLHRYEEEGRKNCSRVAWSPTIVPIDRSPIRIPDFDVSHHVGVEIGDKVGILDTHSHLDKKMPDEIVVEKIEELHEIHEEDGKAVTVEPQFFHLRLRVPRHIRIIMARSTPMKVRMDTC